MHGPRATLARRLVVAAALAASCPLHAAWAAADGEPFRLVWVRGPGADTCVSGPALRERVIARLGKNPFADAARRSIEGTVQRESGRWIAHLYVRGEDDKLTGSRELVSEDTDCTSLDAATVLAVALVIDPEAALRPPPPVASSAPAAIVSAPPPPPRIVEVPASCPAAAPCPAAPAHGATTVTGRALVATALLPKAAAGVALAADVPIAGALRGQAGVFFLPETRTDAGDFAFGLTAATLGLCGEAYEAPRARLSLCGDVAAGGIHAVVFALEPTTPGDRLWTGASGTGKATFRLVGPLIAELGGGAVVPFVRHRFFVEGRPETVFQQPIVSGIAFAGVGLSIP